MVFVKKAENFDHLDADAVTRLLNDYYAARLKNLTDPDKGSLRTAFNILSVAFTQGSWVASLQDAALAKNGIEKIQADGPVCHNYLPDLIAAVEARGSDAAADIRTYNNFTVACAKAAKETPGYDTLSYIQQINLNLKLAKKTGMDHEPG